MKNNQKDTQKDNQNNIRKDIQKNNQSLQSSKDKRIVQKFIEEIAGKKIAIWGLGREGKSTLEFIKTHNINLKELAILDSNAQEAQKVAEEFESYYEEGINSNTETTAKMGTKMDIEMKDRMATEITTKKEAKVKAKVKILTSEEELNNYDEIFKSPGIVIKNKNIDISKITSQTEKFIKLLNEQIIGITGTKGKSTTTSLIYSELKEYFPNTILVGNIGIPAFGKIDEIDENTKIVYELSCHQLEYARYSPHISVILNLYPEHLDHYGTFEKYIAAKLNINKYQNENDYIIFGNTVENHLVNKKPNVINMNNHINGRNIDFSAYKNKDENKINIKENETNLVGEHNLYDIGVAYFVCHQIFKISNEKFKNVLKKFKGLPHRLEYVGNIGGVDYYDDSISTIGDTTIEGVKALRNVDTLLIGGMDRGIDYSDLIDFLEKEDEVKNIILMPDTGIRIGRELEKSNIFRTFKLEDMKANNRNLNNMIEANNIESNNIEIQKLEEGKKISIEINAENNLKINNENTNKNLKMPRNLIYVNNLEEAVWVAKRITKKGNKCLLSPAAASYGIFKNFEERGAYFKKYLKTEK